MQPVNSALTARLRGREFFKRNGIEPEAEVARREKNGFWRLAVAAAMVIVGAMPLRAAVFSWNGPRVEIPDADPAGLTIELEVSGLTGTITDVNFSFNGAGAPSSVVGDHNAGVDHTSPSDLTVTLSLPGPVATKTVQIINAPGVAIDERNFFYTVFDDEATARLSSAVAAAPFSGRFKPVQALSGFDGLAPNGTWQVKFVDGATSDTGGVSSFSLHIQTSGSNQVVGPVAYATTPAKNILSGYKKGSITLFGSTFDYGAAVNTVRARRIKAGVDPATVVWQQAVNVSGDWKRWSFQSVLDVGENRFEIQAFDVNAVGGPVTVRTIVRDDPVYNGPKPDFAYLSEFTSVQVAKTRDDGVMPLAMWNSGTGYHHDVAQGWKTLTADFNGDGMDDLATVTPFSDLWISWNNGSTFAGSFRSAAGFVFDENQGWGVFSGDFDGDGRDDVLQFSPGGHLHIGWSDGAQVASPVYNSTTGFTYRPGEGHWIGIADMNGDGRDDVVYIANNGDVWIALSAGTLISPPVKWASTGFFRHNRGTAADPLNAAEVFLGDFDADGRRDVGHMDVQGNLWVCRSLWNYFLTAPEFWGNHELIYAPLLGYGWNLFTADINADAMEDVLSISQFGDVFAAHSTGNSFRKPDGVLTFQRMYHNILGPRQIFVREFGD